MIKAPDVTIFENAILGHAVADAAGAWLETKTAKEVRKLLDEVDGKVTMRGYKNREEILPPGCPTDDTAMMRALTDSLTSVGFSPEDQWGRYREWIIAGKYVPELPEPYARTGKPGFGYGKKTKKLLESSESLPSTMLTTINPTALGNGALMRTMTIALGYYPHEELIWTYAHQASAVTHNSEESMSACAAYCLLVTELLQGKNKVEALEALRTNPRFASLHPKVQNVLNTDFAKYATAQDFLPTDFDTSSSWGEVTISLKIALWGWLNGDDYEDTLLKLFSPGADTVTYAAIGGGLTAITAPPPEHLVQQLHGADALREDARKLHAMCQKGWTIHQ